MISTRSLTIDFNIVMHTVAKKLENLIEIKSNFYVNLMAVLKIQSSVYGFWENCFLPKNEDDTILSFTE